MDIQVDITHNFWEDNPEVKYIEEFRELFNKLGDIQSSRIMIAIFLVEDPKSHYKDQMRHERISLVCKNFLKKPDLDWGKLKRYTDAYVYHVLSVEEKRFNIISKKADQLVHALDLLDFDKPEDRKEYKLVMADIIKSQELYQKYKAEMVDYHRRRKIKGKNILSVREERQLERKLEQYIDG